MKSVPLVAFLGWNQSYGSCSMIKKSQMLHVSNSFGIVTITMDVTSGWALTAIHDAQVVQGLKHSTGLWWGHRMQTHNERMGSTMNFCPPYIQIHGFQIFSLPLHTRYTCVNPSSKSLPKRTKYELDRLPFKEINIIYDVFWNIILLNYFKCCSFIFLHLYLFICITFCIESSLYHKPYYWMLIFAL